MAMTDATQSLWTTTTAPARVKDYVDLLKPRVMSLVVFTGLVGVMIAPVHIHPFAALLAGQPGGDQGTRLKCRLHHHRAQREAGNDAVAPGKMPGLGDAPELELAHHQPPLGDRPVEGFALRRVGAVEPPGQHGDGPGGKRPPMSGAVDAAKK